VPQALAVLQRADALDPRDSKIKVNLASCYLAMERAAEARAAAQQAVDLEPKAAQAHLMLSQAIYMAGSAEDALAPMQRAVDLEPEDVELLGKLLQLQRASEHFVEGRGTAQRLIEKMPGRWEPWADLAWFDIELKRFDDAQGEIDKARSLSADAAQLAELEKLLVERRGQ
jgi:Flp pilus assembly protein TadD